MSPIGEAPEAWKMGTCCYGPGLNLETSQENAGSGRKGSR